MQMLNRKKLIVGSCTLVVGLGVSSASAVNVVLDFSNEANFFLGNPTALSAVNKAAADLSAALTSNLAATTDTSTGTVGGSSVTYDFSLNYTNPSAGGTVSIANAAVPANEFRVFVGQRNLTGSTLGEGGPGSFGLGASGSGGPTAAAVTAANVAGSANLGRGAGPSYGPITGSFGGGTINVTAGPILGNLWFDVDTDNNGSVDSASTLSNFWHYDPNTPVPSGKIDLYSVALHEIIHALGLGTSSTWDALSSNDSPNWTGTNVISLLGSGANTVAPGHINGSLQSPRLLDGVLQDTVMAPSITFGERKTLTLLDRAFLQDLGYSVAIPEPTMLALLVMAMPLTLRRVRRA
jgi:hypothetical protein